MSVRRANGLPDYTAAPKKKTNAERGGFPQDFLIPPVPGLDTMDEDEFKKKYSGDVATLKPFNFNRNEFSALAQRQKIFVLEHWIAENEELMFDPRGNFLPRWEKALKKNFGSKIINQIKARRKVH